MNTESPVCILIENFSELKHKISNKGPQFYTRRFNKVNIQDKICQIFQNYHCQTSGEIPPAYIWGKNSIFT